MKTPKLTLVPSPTTAEQVVINPGPEKAAVDRALWTIHGALHGASVRARDIRFADHQAEQLDALTGEVERVLGELRNLRDAVTW